jgi:ParB family transcriptional regulator, chromosome partitioning protein
LVADTKEWTTMRELVSIDPFRCRMWEMHDRLEGSVTEHTCRAEIESFAKHGQLMPVLGRRIPGDPDFDVELIYGARRLFVARQLKAKLLVELRTMTDKQAIVAMDIENRQRLDISPYERGVSYASWLRCGYFESQDEIARTLKVSASQVSRLLKLALLPAVVIKAFASPTDIREGWGLRLSEALELPDVRSRLLNVARGIGNEEKKPSAEEIYRQLLSVAGRGKRIRRTAHDEVVRDARGRPLFRIRQQRASIAVVLPLEKVCENDLRRIREAIIEVLRSGRAARDTNGRLSEAAAAVS